ncbi:MAG: prepilin-type N-terminal cleavage/methylation domain-containing protein [Candidatus Thiodiazotropha sp. (ex Myrtea spinifera)]|nr:prepilin-type N-terminal cleavage/methylation domain-containing protein [Candidatus Thiodiazotropha sp. (ex Myrtea spinifera)]MCU7829509.1 prepilin-type N-terminal cleavage/methylation domain-containing protein [Candidatus Thiodiazotropha sp. (ex Myrtea sp. 'scaly one' KF741663)]
MSTLPDKQPIPSHSMRGFTLLEIMVAMLLLTVIVTSSVSLLFLNIRGWDALTADSEAALDEMLISERINSTLQTLSPLVWQTQKGKRLAFEGESKRLHFVSSAPQQFRAGGLFEYLLQEELDSDNRPALILYYTPYQPDLLEFRLPQEGQRRTLISDTGGLYFSFYGRKSRLEQAEWWDNWESDANNYPEVVRIKLTRGREAVAEEVHFVRLKNSAIRKR